LPNKSGEVEIFDSEQKSFAQLKAAGKDENIRILLEELVIEAFAFFDKKPPDIIHRVVYEMIMTEFSNMKPADIKLCLQRGMAAKYGKIDFFHAGTITDWIRQYADGRLDVSEEREIIKASEYKNETWDFSKMPESARKGLIDLGKRLDSRRPEKTKYNSIEHYLRVNFTGEETEKEKFVQREMEWRIDEWKADFEDPHPDGGVPTIDFKQYCEYREKQELIKINE